MTEGNRLAEPNVEPFSQMGFDQKNSFQSFGRDSRILISLFIPEEGLVTLKLKQKSQSVCTNMSMDWEF